MKVNYEEYKAITLLIDENNNIAFFHLVKETI